MIEAEVSVGGEIAARCSRCKLELNHTIVAIYEGKVKRVECLTCGGQHNYSTRKSSKAAAPVKKKRVTRKKKPELPSADLPGRAYAMTETFKAGDVVDHTQYGRGLVEKVRGLNCDVRFEVGVKTLRHGL